jgi:phospholipid/cholesterol/gamma-HCH transport system ATP-binding protein
VKFSVSSAHPERAKSVLTRTIVGLLPKQQGRIDVFGVDLDHAGEVQRQEIERRWGILFQQGALFSSLTVGENVEFPIANIWMFPTG